MALSSAQIVFETSDLVYKILEDGKFTYPELQVMKLVNKTFEVAGDSLYKEQFDTRKKLFNEIYHVQMGKYRKALCWESKFTHSASILAQINTYNLWPFLVHNPDMAEGLFMLWLSMHKYAKHIRNPVTSLMYDVSRLQLSKYVLFEDTSSLTVKTMREMVAFKGIRGAYNMPKRKLKQILQRPKDHVYYWNI